MFHLATVNINEQAIETSGIMSQNKTFFSLYLFSFMCMSVSSHVLSALCVYNALREKKKLSSDPLGLELGKDSC